MEESANKIRFLVAEDDEDDLMIFKEVIQECEFDVDVKIDHALTMDAVLSQSDSKDYHIIFLDYNLGSTNGIEILRALRDKKIASPIIFLTGQEDKNVVVDVMKAGATDYLIKGDLSSKTLGSAIRGALRLLQQQVRRKKAEKALMVQSKLLQGVSQATNRLLTVHDNHRAIQEALGILGEAGDVNNVFIFQDVSDPKENNFDFKLKYYWGRQIENYEFEAELPGLNFSESEGREWVADLQSGGPFQGGVNSFPGPVGEFLLMHDIKSVFLLPLNIDSALWGFIAFADATDVRIWSDDEGAIFRTAVASLEGEIKRNIDQEAFQSIVEGTSSRTGDEFFKSLVRYLASALLTDYVFLCEFSESSDVNCNVIAGWEKKSSMEDDQFQLADSPCEELLKGQVSFYGDEVAKKFPKHRKLTDIKAKSFAGVPFFNSKLNTVGFLAVANDKPILDKDRTISIMRVFASRAGAELERKKGEETIRNMAYYDSLTGLPNRALLYDRSEMILNQAQRNSSMFAVLFLDFDGFKSINDSLGHAIGDLVLKEMAGRLKKSIREGDTVARLGGDEFILLLPELSKPNDVLNIAMKLNEVGGKSLVIGDHDVQISFSIGISIYPIDGDTIKSLMKKADDALYLAKRKGKNTFHFFSPLPSSGGEN